ncbi:LysM peptidoglycan-binding domain-containing protein [Anoxybacillus kestanbolensis]|uniref:C40 family peptidase n=1 Tax=Anoxybacillus kestanbolensis TaxID=227476 RepID=UPI003D216094
MKKTIVVGAVLSTLFLGEKAVDAARYTVKSGDSLSTIARQYNTTITRLLELNPTITDVNRIYVGQTLTVPTTNTTNTTNTTSQLISPRPASTGPTNSASKSYIVQPGDTLSTIARKFNVTLDDLLALNPTITNVNFIRVGQTINVPLSWEERADAIIETGKKYVGAKYLFGAPTTRTDVFDCSSFTQRVYRENGITLPRTSCEQAMVGTEVPLASVRKGDLMFFDTDGDGVINHVSIVVDSETLLHAATGTGVAFANMKPYWAPRAVKAVRLF